MFPGGKGGRCVRLTILPPSCAVVVKSGNLKFLEPSGPLQACNGTALPFLPFTMTLRSDRDRGTILYLNQTRSRCVFRTGMTKSKLLVTRYGLGVGGKRKGIVSYMCISPKNVKINETLNTRLETMNLQNETQFAHTVSVDPFLVTDSW